MKTKILLITLFSLLSFSTYAQNDTKDSLDDITVTTFEFKTENAELLKEFDWDNLKETFKDNAPEKEITISFVYNNQSKVNKSEAVIDNFSLKLSCKTGDLDKVIKKFKKSFKKLDLLDIEK